MLARICDRCGKLYETAVQEINGSIITTGGNGRGIIFGERTYDLCEDCLFSLKRWIEVKPDDEEEQDPYGIPPYTEIGE